MAGGQHGGYRKPSNPAPVSGPGAMSKRTDGGPTQPVMETGGFEYGGRKDFEDIQGGAPMAAAPSGPALPPPTPLFAPTERPDEPVTAGAPVGPGPGPAAPPVHNKSVSARFYELAAKDESGELTRMADILAARGL
jgi:hypothetical protein